MANQHREERPDARHTGQPADRTIASGEFAGPAIGGPDAGLKPLEELEIAR